MRSIGKKGGLDIVIASELFAATLVLFILLNYLSGVATNALFEQNFMARDVALLIDVVEAAPGDVTIRYDTTIHDLFIPDIAGFNFVHQSNISVAVEESKIYVFDTSIIGTQKPILYVFGHDRNNDFFASRTTYAGFLQKAQGTQQEEFVAYPPQNSLTIVKKGKALNITTEQTGVVNE